MKLILEKITDIDLFKKTMKILSIGGDSVFILGNTFTSTIPYSVERMCLSTNQHTFDLYIRVNTVLRNFVISIITF